MAVRPPAATPRKKPRQERSRATVEAILEGAAQVLERRGLAALTTTLVAARAGVSVGTIYQYFPGREAVVGELVRRQRREAAEVVRAAVEATRGRSLRERVRAGLAALLALKRRAPALHRALSLDSPFVDGIALKRQATPRLHQLLRALAHEHAAELQTVPTLTATAVAVHAVEGVLARALQDPTLLASPELERMLTDLVLSALGAA